MSQTFFLSVFSLLLKEEFERGRHEILFDLIGPRAAGKRLVVDSVLFLRENREVSEVRSPERFLREALKLSENFGR
jgi:hypothetical protein